MQQPKLAFQDSVRSSQTGCKFITVYIQTGCKHIKLMIKENLDKKFKTTYVIHNPQA